MVKKKKNKLRLYEKKWEPKSKGEIEKIKGLETEDLSKVFDLGQDEMVDDVPLKAGFSRAPKLDETYKVYDYLLNEEQRLEKLDSFLTQKLGNRIRHPQTKYLIKIQEGKLSILKDQVVARTVDLDSRINRRLKHIWDSAFSD